MSSILKALKKIEHRKAETQLPAWPYGIDNRESTNKYLTRSWRRQRILSILILVCAVALAGKLYYGRQPIAEDAAVKSSLPPETTLPEVSTGKMQSDSLQNKDGKKPPPTSSAASLPPRSSVQNTIPVESMNTSAIHMPPPTPMKDPGLTLQALVWFEQPEDRFAVINDKIVREGSHVNGSIVDKIGPDYVTIRSDGTTWHLKH